MLLPSGSYFHWLLEVLPAALHALNHTPEATVLIPSGAPDYVEQALALLGITRVHRASRPIRIEHLTLVAHNPLSGFVPSEDLAVLRSTFRSLVAKDSREAVYVSRRLQPRHPANEAEVARAFESEGFHVAKLEELSLREQIALFAGARTVAGPHGAGLANIVWSDECKLLEIFVANHFNDCYARLAASLGTAYRAFYCEPRPAPWGTAPVVELMRAVRPGSTSQE